MHNDNQPKINISYCPNCGQSLLDPKSLVNEFSISADTGYFCWCSKCFWRGEIIEITRVIAPELASEHKSRH